MPKRKTAEVNVETAPSAPSRKRKTAAKPTAVAAATHKRPVARNTVSVVAESPVGRAPAHEEIAKLAYLYAEARGFQNGSPEEDWLRAERELLGRM